LRDRPLSAIPTSIRFRTVARKIIEKHFDHRNNFAILPAVDLQITDCSRDLCPEAHVLLVIMGFGCSGQERAPADRFAGASNRCLIMGGDLRVEIRGFGPLDSTR
jgi:hypothetical protein